MFNSSVGQCVAGMVGMSNRTADTREYSNFISAVSIAAKIQLGCENINSKVVERFLWFLRLRLFLVKE